MVTMARASRVMLRIHWLRFGFDALSWTLAISAAALLRYDFAQSEVRWRQMAILILLAIPLQFVIGFLMNLYRGHYNTGTFEEVQAVAVSCLSTGFLLWLGTVFTSGSAGISRSIMLIGSGMALTMMMAGRYIDRLNKDRRRRPGEDATRALVFGAGYVGTHLIQWIATDVESRYRVVGIVDEAPEKQGRKIRGATVLGTLSELPALAADTDAEVLIVAISQPSTALLRRIQDRCRPLGLSIKVMPAMSEVLSTGIRPRDLRDLSIEDLLGRNVIDTHVSEIAGYLTGKRILVTGAGGSIGSQLCIEIKKFGPSELMMLDHDETNLQQTDIAIAGNGLLNTPEVILADIRDAEAIERIFTERRPDVVFHAAALKHLPMLEQYPDEAWKTNVLGTLNVLAAARAANVSTFINISTDKAANPTSVLGHSKRAAEKLTAWAGQETGNRYLSVRFGNVIGSRGSMLPVFQRLIETNKPVTVTHPDITRYFMTIPEACQLVLQAGGIGRVGEVLILDMGEPVRILDIAERMIALSGKNLEVVFTGLREGEKMHEELIGEGEDEARPFHPKISHANVNGIAPTMLDKALWDHVIGSRVSVTIPRSADAVATVGVAE